MLDVLAIASTLPCTLVSWVGGENGARAAPKASGTYNCTCLEEGRSCVAYSDGQQIHCVPSNKDNACSSGKCSLRILQNITGGGAVRSPKAVPNTTIEAQ